ncbi:hypothetical protein FSY45_20360 [Comamonas sp. Z1]|uniref:hypothetical protein n=1 Tax=Comamonas sp. Z1 TaxID=2601246 RepID=UPI0011E6C83E|nr:hypothetical protein [Comamonas sp. Z1]TYK74190.1 hypothetical protein FSY45_20360 [Comamonas sp. Z1]
MEIDDNDLVTQFNLWRENANRDSCYADSQHAGELLTSLQTEWRRRYPSRYVPTPVVSRDDRTNCQLLWSQAEETRYYS